MAGNYNWEVIFGKDPFLRMLYSKMVPNPIISQFNSLWRHTSGLYLTIRLRAQDFYELIVDEAKGRINYGLIEIESE